MITTLNVKRHYYLAQHVDKYIGENIRAVIEMIMSRVYKNLRLGIMSQPLRYLLVLEFKF